ncbi:MAG TPA: phosphatidylglycerophosphatase A [Terriglobia bacterium]|nr:phosphatidylglycerophosphatase A [Terriglobia bacterium]
MIERRPGPAVWIATSGGVGFFPFAPGTAGSAVGLGLVMAIAALPLARIWQQAAIAALALALGALGVWAATQAEKYFAKTDPGQVVIDEVVGQMITLLFCPAATWKWLLAGFVLFRFFDVVKPFPARRLERAPGGWGIMLDDVAAGIYGALALALFGWVQTVV